MKSVIYIALVSIYCIFLIGCSNNVALETQENSKDTLAVTDTAASDNDVVEKNDCPRGTPEAVADTSLFTEHEFYLNKQIGFESFVTPKGDKIQVTNSGCEHYMLAFHIETARFNHKTGDLKYWYKSSAELLSELKDGVKVGFDWQKGVEALKEGVDKETGKQAQLKEEIDFGGTDIRSYVSLDNVQKKGDKYVIEVTFGVGPL
jgi:hypothetical protein